MQGIYTYIPETNYVPREYSVAAILLLLFTLLISLVSVLNLLYFYVSTFRSMCAVPNVAVFCSSLTSCFPGMLLTYFLNDLEIVPVTPIITGIIFVFTFHMHCISIVRSLYFRIFSASLLLLLLGKVVIKIRSWILSKVFFFLLLLLLLLMLLTFMQGIYSYIRKTNNGLRILNVAVAVWLQCLVRCIWCYSPR